MKPHYDTRTEEQFAFDQALHGWAFTTREGVEARLAAARPFLDRLAVDDPRQETFRVIEREAREMTPANPLTPMPPRPYPRDDAVALLDRLGAIHADRRPSSVSREAAVMEIEAAMRPDRLSDRALWAAACALYSRWSTAVDVLRAVRAETDDGSADWAQFHAARLSSAREAEAEAMDLKNEMSRACGLRGIPRAAGTARKHREGDTDLSDRDHDLHLNGAAPAAPAELAHQRPNVDRAFLYALLVAAHHISPTGSVQMGFSQLHNDLKAPEATKARWLLQGMIAGLEHGVWPEHNADRRPIPNSLAPVAGAAKLLSVIKTSGEMPADVVLRNGAVAGLDGLVEAARAFLRAQGVRVPI